MGRIHPYGQEKDCLIFNFVASNTREGRVMEKLFERIHQIEDDLDPGRTGKVFNVLGDVFPAQPAREDDPRDVPPQPHRGQHQEPNRRGSRHDPLPSNHRLHARRPGKRELNLSAIVGKSAEAKERRLVPEVIEDSSPHAGPVVGLLPKESAAGSHVYHVGRVPRHLWPVGDKLEPRFGKLGKEYKQIVFDKTLLAKETTSEWVTPGHPLFETVRQTLWEQVRDELMHGAVFYDLHSKEPYHLDVFSASVKDGLGNELHRRLFVVQSLPRRPDGRQTANHLSRPGRRPHGNGHPYRRRPAEHEQREHTPCGANASTRFSVRFPTSAAMRPTRSADTSISASTS